MADNKKYLKLKEDFFNNDALILLENMPNGYIYSNILLKMYLKCLKGEDRLFNVNTFAVVTRHTVGNVEKALQAFFELGLIEVSDNGALCIPDIQNFIGTSSIGTDQKRV